MTGGRRSPGSGDGRRRGRRRRLGWRPTGAEGGQATVELALVLPFVCGLVLLVVQVALVGRSQVTLHHATREVARAVALDGDVATAVEIGRRVPGLDPGRLELRAAPTGGTGSGPSFVTVEARYRQPLVVPLVSLIRREVNLDSRLIVRAEPP